MDRGVIATAQELFQCRHYPGVVAVITDALENEPECVDALVIRARAHIKLRRDLDAQADLRDIIRLDPSCSVAYRLLGELAARRDENESAGIFFREALRLDPDDKEAAEWLLIVETTVRPAAAAKKLPAPAAAAGRVPARFARGTRAPQTDPRDAQTVPHEGPTVPFARGSERRGELWTPAPVLVRERTEDLAEAPLLHERTQDLAEGSEPAAVTFELPPDRQSILPLPPPPNLASASDVSTARPPRSPVVVPTASPRAKTAPPPQQPAAVARGPLPELPGFGDYLVASGILTRERLRAAMAYQRSMRVQLATAIVTLGLATPQRIEWAAVSHQSQLARERHQQH